jgi:putative oxidoreductase
MIVAIISAKWGEVEAIETLLGFDEPSYLALFLWLAVAGAALGTWSRIVRGREQESAAAK